MYLVNLDKTGSVIMDDSINAIKEFREVLDTRGLGSKGMLWVALFCDYDSVYRHFSEKERSRMISSNVFGDYDWKGQKNKKIAQRRTLCYVRIRWNERRTTQGGKYCRMCYRLCRSERKSNQDTP